MLTNFLFFFELRKFFCCSKTSGKLNLVRKEACKNSYFIKNLKTLVEFSAKNYLLSYYNLFFLKYIWKRCIFFCLK